MVRRPIGVYKHPWDAMQIQTPRNVLAETSINMWALGYADADSAQASYSVSSRMRWKPTSRACAKTGP